MCIKWYLFYLFYQHCFILPKQIHRWNFGVNMNNRTQISSRLLLLIRYRLSVMCLISVRSAYYIGDLLISTSNPPVTHFSTTKPCYWGSPRLPKSIIEHLPGLKYPWFNLSSDKFWLLAFYPFAHYEIKDYKLFLRTLY